MPAPKGHPPYKGCETGGRPRKYTVEFIDKEADELMNWMKDNKNLFLVKFCHQRGYPEEATEDWSELSEKFARAMKYFKERQKGLLFENGLLKRFHFGMAQLILARAHGVVPLSEDKKRDEFQASSSIDSLWDNITDRSGDLLNDRR